MGRTHVDELSLHGYPSVLKLFTERPVTDLHLQVAIIPGDGIGPEIMAVGKAVMEQACKSEDVTFTYTDAPVGGQAIDLTGVPLPEESLKICQAADACLMSAIGGCESPPLSIL